MSPQNMRTITKAGTAIAIVAAIGFLGLMLSEASRHIFGAVLLVGWIAALLAARPLVDRSAYSALWFAFALLGFFLFFLYETYGYTGKVRTFPLLISYMGILFSIFDILSLTASKAGTFVTSMFGKAFDVRNLDGRDVKREIIVLLSMCLIVVAILVLGFLAACPLVVAGWMILAGGKSWKAAILTALGSLVFVYGLFELVLQYELYRGLIVEMIRG